MKVYRISSCLYINDLSGTGSMLYPGRWHTKGTRVLYTASSASLAMLESIVHITSVTSLNMCMICLQLPDAPVKEITQNELPDGWQINPPPDVLKRLGDNLVQENKFLALKVPSAILPEESNYILNPAHKYYNKLRIVYNRAIAIDERFFKIGK